MNFKLLQAEILSYQGLALPVVRLLACDKLSFPADGDTLIKRDILCAQEQAFLGDLPLSDREIREARMLCTSTRSPLLGELLRMEALIADEYKDQQEVSISLYEESLHKARASGDAFLASSDLLNLGMVALDSGHFDEALDFFAQSSALALKIQARQVSQAGLGNSGLAFLHLGDAMRALSTFRQAEEEATEGGVINDRVTWLWDEGISYYRLGNSVEAEACYRRALELANGIANLDKIAGISTELGFLLYEKHQYSLALGFSNDAIRAAKSSPNRAAVIKPLFLRALIATHQLNNRVADKLLLDVHTKSAGDSEIRCDTEDALGNFYNHGNEGKKAELWYRQAIHTFEAQRDSVEAEELKLPFFANGEKLYRDYANFLIDEHQPSRALSLLDQGRARTLSEGLGQTTRESSGRLAAPLHAEDTARKLNATILFYELGPERSYLWAVDFRQTKLFVLPKASELQAAIQSYGNSLQRSGDPLRNEDADATYLYRSLVAPAASMIPANSRVIIIPDGMLNQLNFETLVVPANHLNAPGTNDAAHYWIEDVTLTNASSIRMLARAASKRTSGFSDKLLLFGNPTMGGTGFAELPHAASEVQAVKNQFPVIARTLITQSAATPSAYSASSPEQFGYIHFVAHGTASVLSPLDSAIVLSPSPQHPESYKLYAREIIQHPIHAQLVTISACNGSGQRAYAGEGLVGLSWAFLRAGSHSVIGALWQVDDAATPLIMDRLYVELRARHSAPDAALRNAKLTLLHSSGIYRKPLYWAAFQLYTGS